MRMRKKKYLKERLDDCSNLIIYDILDYNGDIKSVFNDDKPLHMEIGCGKGGFILETARKNPDINFIAVEKNRNVLVLAAEKIKNESAVQFFAIPKWRQRCPFSLALLQELPQYLFRQDTENSTVRKSLKQ